MEISDKDYFEYKMAMGKWTEEQKFLWEYLSNITSLLAQILKKLPEHETEENELKAQYFMGSHGKSSSVPSKAVRSDFSSRL